MWHHGAATRLSGKVIAWPPTRRRCPLIAPVYSVDNGRMTSECTGWLWAAGTLFPPWLGASARCLGRPARNLDQGSLLDDLVQPPGKAAPPRHLPHPPRPPAPQRASATKPMTASLAP